MGITIKEFDAYVGDQRLHLTRAELRILKTLVERAGDAVTHQEIVGAASGRVPEKIGDTSRVWISNIRTKLATAPGAGTIKTVYGYGYLYEKPEAEDSDHDA